VGRLLARLADGDAWAPEDADGFAPWFARVGADDRPDMGAVPLGDRAAVMATTWRRRQTGMRAISEGEGRGDCFLKTHNATRDVAGYSFTNASVTKRVVYLIRDPRDVLISFANHLGETLDQTFARMTDRRAEGHFADAHSEFWGDWGDHVASWTRFERRPVHTLRYEDLRADPQAALRGLSAFLGWDATDAEIAAACAATALDKMRAHEQMRFDGGMLDGRPFFRTGSVGAWRDHPRQDLFAALAKRYGETMAAWGYA